MLFLIALTPMVLKTYFRKYQKHVFKLTGTYRNYMNIDRNLQVV